MQDGQSIGIGIRSQRSRSSLPTISMQYDPFVIRLKSDGTLNATGEAIKRNKVVDGIRGNSFVPENFFRRCNNYTTGIPTYHFAHAVDDHLMRTTHVIRGEEWLPSLPPRRAI